MNYINYLYAHGLKSGDFAHDISPVTVFCGSSFSGKTSRLETIRLGLGSELRDELRGTIIKASQLARDGKIEIELRSNDGLVNRKVFGKGSTVATNLEQIPPLPSVALDSNRYFELSENKRIEFILSLAKIEGQFTPHTVIAALKNVRVENHTAEHEAILSDIIPMATDGIPIQQWLDTGISNLKERLKLATATAKRMGSVVAGITQLTSAELPAQNFAAEIEAKRKELDAVNQVIGGIEQSLREYKALQGKVEKLQSLLAQTPAVEIPNVAPEIERLEQSIKSIDSAKVDADYVTKIDALTKSIESIQGEIESHKSQAPDLQRERHKLTCEHAGLEREMEGISRSIDMADKLHLERVSAPCCPECGTPTDLMRERLEERHHNTRTALCAELAKRQGSISGLNRQIQEAELKLTVASEADKIIATKTDQWKQMLHDLKALIEERQSVSIGFTEQIHNTRQKIQALRYSEVGARATNSHRDLIVQQLAAAERELEEFPVVAKNMALENVTQDHARLVMAINSLEAAQRDYQRQQDDERRNNQAIAENLKAQADVVVTKACLEVLEDLRAKMVETAFAGILKTVNRITAAGRMKEPIEYRDGELGRWKRSTWISHQSFSGTEKALTYAGISLALAGESPLKLVCIDELGRMDRQTLYSFLVGMVEMVKAGELGQFVGAYSGDLDSAALPGVQVVALP